MATQVGITKLERIQSYLAAQMVLATTEDRLFAVTDAALSVTARIATLILINNYGEQQ